jgi:hypothetical protein
MEVNNTIPTDTINARMTASGAPWVLPCLPDRARAIISAQAELHNLD